MIPAPLLKGKGKQKEEFFEELIGEILEDPVFYNNDTLTNITREPYGEF